MPLAQSAGAPRRVFGALAARLHVLEDLDAPLAQGRTLVLRGQLMRLLLDTHPLFWALAEPARLGPKLQALVEDSSQEVSFSAVSI